MTREELMDKLFDIAVRYYSHDAPTPDVGVSRSEHLLRMLRMQADWVLAHHDDIFGEQEPSRKERNKRMIALLDKWLADESGYDEAVYPVLEAALKKYRGVQI